MSPQFVTKNWKPVKTGRHGGTSVWSLATKSASSRRPRGKVSRKRNKPHGSYVYAWFNESSDLPFYIGRGEGWRAWDRHIDKSGLAQPCQMTRSASKRFRVVILRDNLTLEGAILLESCLISFVSQIGHVLTNQMAGSLRQEVPPLELPLPAEPRQSPQDAFCGQSKEPASDQPFTQTPPQNANAGLRGTSPVCEAS